LNIKRLVKAINKSDFYRAVYTLQRFLAGCSMESELGSDTLPKNERIRFKVPQNLGFPGSAIESINDVTGDDGIKRLEVYVNFMGLTGPSGALPRHYTELVMQRTRLKDVAIREFFDLFNHRLITLNYRAWEKYQFPIQHEYYLTGKNTSIDDVLKALTGASQNLDVFLGGLLAMPIRNTQSLRQILELLSGCDVEIREFVGRWMVLDESDQTQLGSRVQPEGQHAQLGMSTIVGQKVWDISSAIEVDLQVNNRDMARAVMSQGRLMQILKQVVAHYVPSCIQVRWRLTTTYRNLPIASLADNSPGLGLGGALMISRHLMDKKLSIPVG